VDTVELAYIPSPTSNVWYLGPVPLRAYAIAIIVGIGVAVWLADRRWVARGGRSGTVADIAVWAVIFGLVGGRLYHVLTDPELYFGAGRHPVDAFKIWQGGLGIWGAIGMGALGAWIAARRRGISFGAFADAAAPAVALAQGIGRIGNWFNNELYGRATTRPWGLTIYDIDPATHHARRVDGDPVVLGHFQPTFLYELVWDVGVAGVVIWADRRFRLGRGRAFALYAMAYTVGRLWVEFLRVDQANHILGLRLNVWTSMVVFLGALVLFVTRRGPREQNVEPVTVDGRSLEAGEAGDVLVTHGNGIGEHAEGGTSNGGTKDGTGDAGHADGSGGHDRRPETAGDRPDGQPEADRQPPEPADAVGRDRSPTGGEVG